MWIEEYLQNQEGADLKMHGKFCWFYFIDKDKS